MYFGSFGIVCDRLCFAASSICFLLLALGMQLNFVILAPYLHISIVPFTFGYILWRAFLATHKFINIYVWK